MKKSKICWLHILFIIFSTQSLAVKESKLKKVQGEYGYLFGIKYSTKERTYSTLSIVSGESEDLYEAKTEPVLLKKFSNDGISFALSTYEEFKAELMPLTQEVKYFNSLPIALDDYLKILNVEPFEVSINYVLISSPKSIYTDSIKRLAQGEIILSFIDNIYKIKINNFSENVEKYVLSTLAHEYFHFLAKHLRFVKMNELRSEVYASLFGHCVAYSINPEIIRGIKAGPFPDHVFIDYKKDIRKIAQQLKKRGLIKSTIASIMSEYYFRAIANNKSGVNISSKKIPQFCRKLFSEKNFKHPIEKKPPVWFEAFMKE